MNDSDGNASPDYCDMGVGGISMDDNTIYDLVKPATNAATSTHIAQSASKGSSTNCVQRVAILLCICYVVATVGVCIAFATKISLLKSEATSSRQKFEDSLAGMRQLNDTIQELSTVTNCNPIDMINSSSIRGQLLTVPNVLAPSCGVGWRLAVSLDMGDPSQQCPSP